MIIAALNESNADPRVAITPQVLKQYKKLGYEVCCEVDAGQWSGFSDKSYEEAGAAMVSSRKSLLSEADILVCVREPSMNELKGLRSSALLIAPIENNSQNPLIQWCLKHRITVFSMNAIPRISRAQSMDSLSSQANLAGYRAVIEAIYHFKRMVPMMMTPAGMVTPAKVLILGVGVAGLQAIATAKRLGAIVYGYDVRSATKEQVESLGAEFIQTQHAMNAETDSGYASEILESEQKHQAELIDHYAQQSDIVICTALIPGKKAPVLLRKETVDKMKPNSIIVDLATSHGGNCEVSEPDEVITYRDITIIGDTNLPGKIPTTASELYANNIYNLIHFFNFTAPPFKFAEEDVIIQNAILCHDGQFMPFQYKEE